MDTISVCIVEDNDDIRQAAEQIIMMAEGYQFRGSFTARKVLLSAFPG